MRCGRGRTSTCCRCCRRRRRRVVIIIVIVVVVISRSQRLRPTSADLVGMITTVWAARLSVESLDRVTVVCHRPANVLRPAVLPACLPANRVSSARSVSFFVPASPPSTDPVTRRGGRHGRWTMPSNWPSPNAPSPPIEGGSPSTDQR